MNERRILESCTRDLACRSGASRNGFHTWNGLRGRGATNSLVGAGLTFEPTIELDAELASEVAFGITVGSNPGLEG